MGELATSKPESAARRTRRGFIVAALALGMLILAAVTWFEVVVVHVFPLEGVPTIWYNRVTPFLWPGIRLARGGMSQTWPISVLAVLMLIGLVLWAVVRYSRRRFAWLWVPALSFALALGYVAVGEWVLSRPAPRPVTTRLDDQPVRLRESYEEYQLGFRLGEAGFDFNAVGPAMGFYGGMHAGRQGWFRFLGKDSRLDPPLIWAVTQGDEREVERLLKAGADVDTKGYQGSTPLLLSIERGPASVSMVELLLSHGADIDAMSISGGTVLCAATSPSCPMETFEYLLAAGADLRKGPRHSYPLRTAAVTGEIQRAARLLEVARERGVQLQLNDAMLEAAENNQGEMVAFLIEQGADITYRDAAGRNVWLRAYRNNYSNNERTLQLLRDLGADTTTPE